MAHLIFNDYDFGRYFDFELLDLRPMYYVDGEFTQKRTLCVRFHLTEPIPDLLCERNSWIKLISDKLTCEQGSKLLLPWMCERYLARAYITDVTCIHNLCTQGYIDVTFSSDDPYFYGHEYTHAETSFNVCGDSPSYPHFLGYAQTGQSVMIINETDGVFFHLVFDFTGNELVDIDFDQAKCLIDNTDASANINFNSKYFCLNPGPVELTFSGFSDIKTTYSARWV